MKMSISLLTLFLLIVYGSIHAADTPAPSHDIAYPEGWDEWAAIGMAHRTDNNTVRVILGNDTAIEAARTGQTNPWPDGSVLGKVVWKQRSHPNWEQAVAPGEFVHAEFMFKDSKKYSDTYNWGWARWVGVQQKPFQGGMNVCIDCHTPVRKNDWVFTVPASFP